MLSIPSDWAEGIPDEIAFWDKWLSTRGLDWQEEFARRLDPALPLQSFIRSRLPPDAGEVRILDAGAGPLTLIGKKFPGALSLFATDILADAYDGLLQKNGIEPIIRTSFAPNETLALYFDRSSFDVVHCCNALDHSFDPVTALRQMLAITKIGGCVILSHSVDEAEKQSYQGLHKHNFYTRSGKFFVSNQGGDHLCVDDSLGIACEFLHHGNSEWLTSIIVKRQDYSDAAYRDMYGEDTSRIRDELAQVVTASL